MEWIHLVANNDTMGQEVAEEQNIRGLSTIIVQSNLYVFIGRGGKTEGYY